jgi:hypothetical protein
MQNNNTLGKLNWFSFKDSLPFESQFLTVWQAVAVLLDLSDACDEIVKEYITEMGRIESEEYDDLVQEKLESQNKFHFLVSNIHKVIDDPNNEDPNNLLLENHQVDSELIALNQNRMRVIEGVDEAGKWFNRLKEEIIDYRTQENCRLKITHDNGRDDFDQILMTLESIKEYLAGESQNTGKYNYEKPKQLTWQDITIEITLAVEENTPHDAVIKIKKKKGVVINQGTTKELGFQGTKSKHSNMKLKILFSFCDKHSNEYLKLKNQPSFKKELSRLRTLLRTIVEIESDPFCKKQKDQRYQPRFKVIITEINNQ